MRRVIRKIQLKTVNVSRGRSLEESMKAAPVVAPAPVPVTPPVYGSALEERDMASVAMYSGIMDIAMRQNVPNLPHVLREIVSKLRRQLYVSAHFSEFRWTINNITRDAITVSGETHTMTVNQDTEVSMCVQGFRENRLTGVDMKGNVYEITTEVQDFEIWRNEFRESELIHPYAGDYIPIGPNKVLMLHTTGVTY